MYIHIHSLTTAATWIASELQKGRVSPYCAWASSMLCTHLFQDCNSIKVSHLVLEITRMQMVSEGMSLVEKERHIHLLPPPVMSQLTEWEFFPLKSVN